MSPFSNASVRRFLCSPTRLPSVSVSWRYSSSVKMLWTLSCLSVFFCFCMRMLLLMNLLFNAHANTESMMGGRREKITFLTLFSSLVLGDSPKYSAAKVKDRGRRTEHLEKWAHTLLLFLWLHVRIWTSPSCSKHATDIAISGKIKTAAHSIGRFCSGLIIRKMQRGRGTNQVWKVCIPCVCQLGLPS